MENQASSPTQRPVFLTIVCIISFVGLGWTIIKSLILLSFSSVGSSLHGIIKQNLDIALMEASSSDPYAEIFLKDIFESILKLFEKMPLLGGIMALLALIALTGVILMWNLKKTGFYLYTSSKVILIFIPVILLGYNFISMMMTMGFAVGSAIFITLYGFNLKSMK